MSIAKDMYFEELEREEKRLEGKCRTCEEELSEDEKDTGRDECFACYCDRHD